MYEPPVVVQHCQPPHQGWKSWCSGCARSKEQVERLTGIYGGWTDQEKKGIKISQKEVDRVIELAKTNDIRTVSEMTRVSRTSVWRIVHGHWNQKERI